MKVAIINLDDSEVVGSGYASELLGMCFDDVKPEIESVSVDGASVTAFTLEFDKEQYRRALMKLRHNARNAGRRKAKIYTKDESCKGLTWPQFVEAAQDLSQSKIIETFGLVTHGEWDESEQDYVKRPVSRKFLVERMARAAEAWEEGSDETRSFLDYLNWDVRN